MKTRSLWSVAGLFWFACAWGQIGVNAAEEEALMMSPYEVVAESAEFKGWKKVRSPNFVVYTDASAKKVRPFLEQMEMMHMVAQVLTGRRPLNHQPVHVVLPTSRSDWKKLRSKGSVEWKVAVSREDEFSYLCVVEYDWQAEGIYVMWASLAAIESTILGIKWSFPIEKGFAYYFETIRPTKDGVKVGVGNPRIHYIKERGWLDWGRFFAIEPSSPEFVKGGPPLHKFNGQASAFVHYYLAKPPEEGLSKLLEWSARLNAGREPSEAEFQDVFGMTFEELDEVMRKYVAEDKFLIRNYGIPDEMTDFVVTEIDVSAKEMRELFVLVQIKNQRIDDSKIALDSLLAKGVETPHLQALLVSACRDWKRPEAALRLMTEMVKSGDDAAETWDGLAALTFYKEVGLPTLESRIPASRSKQIITLAEGAIAREPFAPSANPTLAWTLALQEDLTATDLDLLREICRRMDGNGDTSSPLAALALASWRLGEVELSRRLVDLLLASPYIDKHILPLIRELDEKLG